MLSSCGKTKKAIYVKKKKLLSRRLAYRTTKATPQNLRPSCILKPCALSPFYRASPYYWLPLHHKLGGAELSGYSWGGGLGMA